MHLPKNWVEDLWRAASLQVQEASGLEVSGVKGQYAELLNGRYVAAPGAEDRPPCYRRLQHDVWLYYSTDGSWNMGGTKEHMKDASDKGGWARSETCQVGRLPFEGLKWKLFQGTGLISFFS